MNLVNNKDFDKIKESAIAKNTTSSIAPKIKKAKKGGSING